MRSINSRDLRIPLESLLYVGNDASERVRIPRLAANPYKNSQIPSL